MRRKLVAAAAAAATVAATAVTAAPVFANGSPVGGCPPGDGWVLAQTSAVIPAIDNGNYADQNGDGFACFRVNKGQTDKNGGASYTWKDNTNPAYPAG